MSWINGFIIGMTIGIVIMGVQFFSGAKFQKMRKSLVFVKHIEHHLETDEEFKDFKNPVVMCKICEMTIDDIYKLESKRKELSKNEKSWYEEITKEVEKK